MSKRRNRAVDPDDIPNYGRRRQRPEDAARRASVLERLQRSKHLAVMANAEKLRRSLHEYTRAAWPIIEPITKFVDNWHIGVVCEHLEALLRSEIKFLVINVPPGTMKSLLTNVMAPSWAWAQWPEKRMAFVAGSDGLETRDSLKCRRIIESSWYQERWGHVYQISSDQNAKTRYENDKTGVRAAQTFMSAVIGERAEHWFFDDPHKTDTQESDDVRLSKVTKFKEEYASRGSDIRTSTKCIIMQRIHENDICGYVLAEGLADAHVFIPMRWEPPERVFLRPRFKDPRTGKLGRLLDPVRFPEKELKELERTLGSYATAGQMQQRPAPRGGGIFKRNDWQFYKTLPELDEVIGSWDMKFKEVATASYVAGQAWGRKGANKYLLPGRVRDHLGFGASLMAVKTQRAKLVETFGAKVVATLIEDKANGPAIIETARTEVSGLIPVEPQGGKEARAYAIQPEHEAHNLFLPHPSLDPTIEDFIARCGRFPAGDTDEVDAMTQAITWLKMREGFGLWLHLKSQKEEQDRARAEAEERRRKGNGHTAPPAVGAAALMETMR